MRVTVRVFASLKDLVGTGELVRNVPPGATVGALWDVLAQDFPVVREHRASVSCAVNAEYTRMDAALADGDEVAFLPPVSGG